MAFFNIVAESNESTVVTEYKPATSRSDAYQSETDLEREFIRLLGEQSYEYLPIKCEEDLIKNLRKKLEELNDYTFSDDEWKRFFNECIANTNESIVSSFELRSKKQLIDGFIDGINDVDDVMNEWRTFVAEEKEKQLNAIIEEEKLKPEETRNVNRRKIRRI